MPDVIDPVHDPLSPTQKPASETLEGKLAQIGFYAGTVLTFLGVLLDAGALGHGQAAMIIGALIAAASKLGLLTSRTMLKIAANDSTARAAAIIEAAKASNPS